MFSGFKDHVFFIVVLFYVRVSFAFDLFIKIGFICVSSHFPYYDFLFMCLFKLLRFSKNAFKKNGCTFCHNAETFGIWGLVH